MIAKLLLLAALQDAPLQVMTYNIRYDNPRDGVNAWFNRRDDMIGFLRRRRPDIIGLQEALRGQLDDLRALSAYGEVGRGRDDGGTAGEYAAILYRTERLELLESGTFWFSDTPDVPGSRSWGNNVTRICTWARFRETRDSVTFYVFNVHLDHESQPSRERSVEALLAAIDARGHPQDPVIVTGDFNAGPGNPALQAMSARLRDTYPSRDTLDGTFNGFREDSLGPKIDFIFTSPQITSSHARIERPRTGAGRQMSDHFLVSVQLALPGRGFDTRLEEITVSATRIDRRIEDQPLRVEVVSPEEIEEKVAMTPGDISMLLNETGGLRVASTAPATGGSAVRIHGLPGRYTAILADGLPLYGEAGALSIMQIPPLDLMQVEIVKGPASAMYGGAAVGGLINLVSRRPHERRSDFLLNGTSLGGGDGVVFLSRPLGGPWGFTVLGGLHGQARRDLDDDGWSEVPGYTRGVFRPRLFYGDGEGRTLFATIGVMAENRTGGTMAGDTVADGSSWPEGLRTRRFDAGLSARGRMGDWDVAARFSGMMAQHRHDFGGVIDEDRHTNALAELTISRRRNNVTWLFGIAQTYDAFRSDSVSRHDYNHSAPALFSQVDVDFTRRLAGQISVRLDMRDRIGTRMSPRASLLYRMGSGASIRFSAAEGYFQPTPFVDAAEAVGLRNVVALGPLQAERVALLAVDVALPAGPVETNISLFNSYLTSHVRALTPYASPILYDIRNARDAQAAGVDIVSRYASDPWHVVLSWNYAWLEESDADGFSGEHEVPLNPRHSAGLVAAYETEGWRIGAELYYVGPQQLETNPYRQRSPAYTIAGMLVQRRIGRATLFLNLENLGDTRLGDTHPLLLPGRAPLTGWTTDVWGPLDGRAINGGVRFSL